MAKERLPFELAKPDASTFVTQATEIGYNGEDLKKGLDNNLPHNSLTDDADFAISDGNGNDIFQIKNGIPRTKQFDAGDSTQAKDTTSDADFAISDGEGHDILQVDKGYPRTKNFDAKDSAQAKSTTEDADFAISDGEGNDIFQVRDGYPFAKNFNGKRLKEDVARLINNPSTPSGSGDASDAVKSITIFNSDKIGIIGDSYTESAYAINGKSYIAKLSLFSDFQYVNFGASGDIYLGRINAIRNKSARYGTIPFDEQGITYAMLCCYTNDLKVMNINDYLNSLRTAIRVVKNIGITPIVCTEYHTASGLHASQVRSGMKNVADEFGLKYFDIASIVDLTMGNRYAPFWGGSHPATRTNAIESDNYQKYLERMTPIKSLKVFRGRMANVSSLDDLMFSTNYERAKLFKEINVGANDISNSTLVDNLGSASIRVNNSEYQSLMKKNGITMPKYALVSAVMPSIARDLTYLTLNIDTSTDVDVYVKSSMARPFANPQSLSSFYIDSSNAPQVGAVYRCNEDSKEYTVVGGLTDDAGDYHLLCSPSVSPSKTTGTLTKVSGTGNSSISYKFREIGYSPNDISSDLGGHWTKVDISGGIANVTSLIGECVDIDKVHFLVVSNSEYQLNDVSISYKSLVDKTITNKHDYTFESNYYSSEEELLPSNTFGAVGSVDSRWGVTPIDVYEKLHGTNVYPKGCNSAVKVTDSNRLNCTVASSKTKIGDAVLEIWCRYFPEVYTNGSGNQITESSFDYNEIYVNFGDSNTTLKDYANTHWKIIRFNVNIASVNNIPISIYSNANGIEIAYVSLKYKK